MRAESISRTSYSRGFAAVEILVAFSVLTLALTAIITVTFGSQSVVADSQANQAALYKAQQIMEASLASSFNDFDSVISSAGTWVNGITYSTSTVISNATQCSKQLAVNVSWQAEHSRPMKTTLASTLINVPLMLALGGDCDNNPPVGGWTLPNTLGSVDIGPGEQATGVNAKNQTVFLSAKASAVEKPDFFAVDATNGSSPTVISDLNTGPGLNAIDVSQNQITGEVFVYAANNDLSQQLQIIDVTSPASPALISSANLQPSPLGTNSEGRSIFYYNKKVYVGTGYLPAVPPNPPRPEFHIFNVSDSTSPVELGSYDVNHNINNIIVNGKYAYLATSDNNGEVWILDISNSAAPAFVSKFDALGSEDGDSIYLVGNTLYLGRDQAPSSRPDFYVLDVSDPLSITIIGSKNLSMNPSTAKINAIRVSGRFAFLATGDSDEEFQVLDISNPSNIPAPIGIYNFPQEATGADLENNLIYASVKSNDGVRIIRPAQCADKIDNDSDGKIDIADPQCYLDGTYNSEDDDEAN